MTTKASPSKTTAKSKSATPKPRRKSPAVTSAPVDAPDVTPVFEPEAMSKRELLELVVQRSGVKKRDAKPAVEAMLEVLGETLAEGRPLNLPPFGKAKVTRSKEMGNGRLIVTRLRQKDRARLDDKQGLAEAAE